MYNQDSRDTKQNKLSLSLNIVFINIIYIFIFILQLDAQKNIKQFKNFNMSDFAIDNDNFSIFTIMLDFTLLEYCIMLKVLNERDNILRYCILLQGELKMLLISLFSIIAFSVYLETTRKYFLRRNLNYYQLVVHEQVKKINSKIYFFLHKRL